MFVKRLIRVLHFKGCVSLPRLDSTIRYVTNSRCINNLNGGNENVTFNNLNRQTDLIDDTAVRIQKIYKMNNPNYISAESYYARDILERSQVYSKSLAVRLSFKENLQVNEDILLQNWISMDNADLLNNFELLSFYASTNNETMNDYKYRGIIEVVIGRISQFSTKELCNFLSCLELWNPKNNTMYNTDLLQALDNECLKRMKNWTIDEIFLINDHFFKLKLQNITKFPMESLKNVNPHKMTPTNLIQFAFLLKVNKRIHVDLKDLEHCLEKCIDNFNVDELGILAMAYFKYKTSFRSHVFLKFIHKLIANIDTVKSVSLSSILKILRYSSDLTTLRELDILLSLLENQISRLDLPAITHIAHLKAIVLIYNKNLMSKILERYTKEIDKTRLKDIERVLLSLYIFNYDPQTTSFYTLVNNELLSPYRISEINAYPSSLVYSVMFMLQINYYPEKVLKYIMEPDFINKFSKNNADNLDREYLVMDYCIEIDHPEYNGPRVKKYLLNYLQKKCQSNYEKQRLKLKYGNKLMIDVAHTCKQVFGNDSAVYIDSVLPHFIQPDIIICYDPEMKQFVSPEEKLSHISQNEIKFAPKDGKEWYALVMGVHNILIRNTFEHTGILTAKLRHLRKIGYTPIVIPYVNWKSLKSLDKKKKFIEYLLNK